MTTNVPEPERDLSIRTKEFARRVVRLYSTLPTSTVAQVLGKQLLRAGTSVGAHYSEAPRARSKAEFISKLRGGLQELEETIYWLELLLEAKIGSPDRLQGTLREAREVAAMMTASVTTAGRNR
jgi:four helix bundle protein